MNLKFEILLLFIGGFIRILVIGSDIWYITLIKYNTSLTFYLSIASLVAPTSILLLVYVFLLFRECFTKELTMIKLFIALLFIFGDSIGLNYFVFSVILCRAEVLSGDFYIIDSMFRATALINSIFQSMPQLILQIYNNQLIQSWGVFTIFSVGMSSISLLYTISKLVYALDKIKQYEHVVSRIDMKTVTQRKPESAIVPTNAHQDDEIYDSGDN